MIPKSGHRFSEKIMRKQKPRIDLPWFSVTIRKNIWGDT